MLIFCQLFFGVLFVFNITAILYTRGLKLAVFHPTTVLGLYFLTLFFIPSITGEFYIYQTAEKYTKYIFNQIPMIMGLLVLVYFLVSIITIIDIYRRKQRNTEKLLLKKYGCEVELFIFFFLLLIYLVMFLMIYKNGGFKNLLTDLPSFMSRIRNGSTLLIRIITSVQFLPLFYLIYKNRPNKLFLAFIFINSFLIIFSTGARLGILFTVVFVVLFFLRYERIKTRGLMRYGVLFFGVFVLISGIRTGFIFEPSKFSEKISAYFGRNMDQFSNTLLTRYMIETERVPKQYGFGTFQDCSYYFLPSAIFPNKPISYSPTRLLYPANAKAGYSLNFGLIGRSYIEFGWLGVILINILTLYLYIKVYNHFLYRKMNKLNLMITIYLLGSFFQLCLLGAVSHMISHIIFHIILLGLIHIAFLIYRNTIIVKK